jgi:hypothetical protein
MPKPYKNLFQAYRSIIPAILKQSKDKDYFVDVEVPDVNN